MFGVTPLQKVLNGLSCAVLILMLVVMFLFAFGVFSNERYEYKISKSELGIKFGYHIEPSLKDYIIPAAILSVELAKKERAASYFFKPTSAKLELEYDDDTHEFLYLSASLSYSNLFEKEDLKGLYEVFERSVDEFVGLSR